MAIFNSYVKLPEGRCPVLSMRTGVSGHISLQFGKELQSLWAIEVWGFQDWNTGRGPKVTCYHGLFEDSYGGGKT